MELQIFIELGITGIVVGFMAGLLGLGGGLLMVPVLSFILGNMGVAEDLSIKMAIVTSMSTILFTSISSVRTHHKLGAVRWDLVKGLAPGIVIGSALASLWIFVAVKGATLAIFFGVFVSYSAFQMYMDKKPKPSRQMPGFVGQLGMGGLIGMLSGLVGAGGAFVSVPFDGMVQRGHSQRHWHQCRFGLSHCTGQCHRLCHQRPELRQLATRFSGLHLVARHDCHCLFQRVHSTLWRTRSTSIACEKTQAGVFILLGVFWRLTCSTRA
jgi:hypothetical protein